jgi:hypothetical protein
MAVVLFGHPPPQIAAAVTIAIRANDPVFRDDRWRPLWASVTALLLGEPKPRQVANDERTSADRRAG